MTKGGIRIKAYKLLRKKKDGLLYPLFIHKQYSTPIGEWLQAECYPTKGFAVRKGWHTSHLPQAPHLKMNLASGEVRVWCECEIEDYVEFLRPAQQGGMWFISQRMKLIRELTNEEVENILIEYHEKNNRD